MTFWIAAALTILVVQTLMPATMRYLGAGPGVRERLVVALGPRDEQPPLSVLGGRAERALHNVQEAMPVFLTLALLHVVQRTTDELGTTGAAVFVVARAAYVPAYRAGIPGVRSTIWTVSWVGLAMMIASFRSRDPRAVQPDYRAGRTSRISPSGLRSRSGTRQSDAG